MITARYFAALALGVVLAAGPRAAAGQGDARPTSIRGACEEMCEKEWERQNEKCRRIKNKKKAEACWAAANLWYANCLAGCSKGGTCK
jgi:hypothetical protein